MKREVVLSLSAISRPRATPKGLFYAPAVYLFGTTTSQQSSRDLRQSNLSDRYTNNLSTSYDAMYGDLRIQATEAFQKSLTTVLLIQKVRK